MVALVKKSTGKKITSLVKKKTQQAKQNTVTNNTGNKTRKNTVNNSAQTGTNTNITTAKQTTQPQGNQYTDYNSWVASLKSRYGLTKTTHISEKRNETNFAEYAAALSDSLKQEIVNSFDCDADYELQAKIAAGLYGANGKSNIKNGDLKSSLKKMGFEVTGSYEQTSYIKDFKNHGGYLTQGHVTVFTVKDPSTGAEIKIVDANGNGAIEVEELFLNELLTGISKDIDVSTLNIPHGQITSSGSTQSKESGSSGGKSGQTSGMGGGNMTQGGKTQITSGQYETLRKQLQNKYSERNGGEAAVQMAANYLEANFVISDEAKPVSIADIIKNI